jgi:hypothetical protein
MTSLTHPNDLLAHQILLVGRGTQGDITLSDFMNEISIDGPVDINLNTLSYLSLGLASSFQGNRLMALTFGQDISV